jgi:hypothetical protein
MKQMLSPRLDRIFARTPGMEPWPSPSERWNPPWQPRGRWWMRAPRASRISTTALRSAWRRLTRPARAS